MSDLPEPLTPADCDLQGLQFMPLDVSRLRDSDLASDETPEACWAAVLLWCASWHQVPAASIPDNDLWIAKQAGYAARGRIDTRWKKVRDGALRGWIKCSDGRLYHPTVAEKANEAWDRREEWREVENNKNTRQRRWRLKIQYCSSLLRDAGVTPPFNPSLKQLLDLCVKNVDDFSSSDVDSAVNLMMSTQPKEASTGASQQSTNTSTKASRVDGTETAKTGTGTGTGTGTNTNTIHHRGDDDDGTSNGVDVTAWSPDDSAYLELDREQCIPTDFSMGVWIEFREFWAGKQRLPAGGWKSRFVQRVLAQWARRQQQRGYEAA